MQLRVNPVIQTYSGRAFNLVEPHVRDFKIDDIAQALSNLCRFTGHVKKFYSVAEHSVNVASLVPEPLKLHALLHDLSEAYCNDLSTPLKYACGGMDSYREIEKRIGASGRYVLMPFAATDDDAVKRADLQMMVIEARQLLKQPLIEDWRSVVDYVESICEVPEVKIQCWSPARARKEFLSAYKRYHM